MDAPRLALRFREITPHVDTIYEHRKILEGSGAVWWGWWRKDFEPEHKTFLARLVREGEGHALLLDRNTRRCFSAHYLRIAGSNAAGVNEERVPPYYRGEMHNVSGWFLLDRIDQIEFQEDIAARFGQSTLLKLEAPARKAKSMSSAMAEPSVADGSTSRRRRRTGPVPMPRSAILHLSDLHFGKDYSFLPQGTRTKIGETRKTLTYCLTEDLRRVGLLGNVGLLLVTGDFTTQGDWSDLTRQQILREFKELTSALDITEDQIIAIPGNHDIIRYKPDEKFNADAFASAEQTRYQHETYYRTFLEELTGRSWKEPLQYHQVYRHTEFDLVVVALNSCTITATEWTEYGYVGDLGVSVLDAVGKMSISRPTYRLMSLHHHVVPVNKVEAPNSKGVSLTLDAIDILDAGQRSGFHFLVHGHQHLTRVSKYGRLPRLSEGGTEPGELFIISGGSAGAVHDRLPGAERNTYTVLTLGKGDAQLTTRELRTDAKAGATLYDCYLPVSPVVP
ncbi:MAG TPA: metallophosphoesterase [Pyrinomonadaceae bacterium]|jgi:predicted MPP superfamily phosphohydrolase|nr:metallophosphoesterase [Pyrinomonadaceae bacterium]